MTVLPMIDGWTSDAEAAELARLVSGMPPKRVLEVGAFKGFGTVLMARAGAEVWAIDWHRGDADLGARDTLCAWWTNVRRHHVEDQVVGLVGRSQPVMAALRTQCWDVAFIDGYHAYEAVVEDIESALPLVRPGGLLVFHDYCMSWGGVVRAVDELVARLVKERRLVWQPDEKALRVVDSLAIVALKDSL